MAAPPAHSTIGLLCVALLGGACDQHPGETADSEIEVASAGCISCHGSEEILEAEVDPDTGESESEGSGEG